MEPKLCKRCGETKPHSEFYPRKWRTKGGERLGLYPWCKQCSVDQKKEYYRADPERVKARVREHELRNPEKSRAWHAAAKAEFKKRNPKRQSEYVRRWEAKNPEKAKEMLRRGVAAFHKRNPTYERRRQHQRRAALLAGGSYTERDLLRLFRRHGGLCAYCMKAEADTIDHVIPLARGGRNTIGNLLPACRRCNSRKHARLLVEWRSHKGQSVVA
jgi:5-methylcytosine-specific restriction endonuclease McrA